jgi:pantoate--beta-alanine ligase
MSKITGRLKQRGRIIGFVPTMGALHEGHLSLIRQARKECDCVVVSIFVNPAQFGPRDDFRKYPRNLKADAKMCRRERVNIIFYPDAKQMYPANYKTYVNVDELSDGLCGKFRPGHFKGVATVVTKLFHIVSPDIAYFGQKDAQQAVIIKRLVQDLNIPLQIRVMPTVRDADGLAMSSRNAYLSPEERKDAAVLSLALNLARDMIRAGEVDALEIIKKMWQLINKKKALQVQYISIVDLKDLKPVFKIKDTVLIALAVRAGKARLIDNIIVNPMVRLH